MGVRRSRSSQSARRSTPITPDATIPSRCSETLKKIYGDDETIKSLKEDELVELGENLRHGVPIATPVFDGAKEKISKTCSIWPVSIIPAR